MYGIRRLSPNLHRLVLTHAEEPLLTIAVAEADAPQMPTEATLRHPPAPAHAATSISRPLSHVFAYGRVQRQVGEAEYLAEQ